MIDLYFSTSPNVYKVGIMLEEIGAEYRLIPVDLRTGAQFDPEQIGGGPTGKIPVIVDHAPADGGDPLTLFESGAILSYLAEKAKRLAPTVARRRGEMEQWLFWQMSGLGPFSGQCFHFRMMAGALAPAVEHAYARGRYEKIMAAHWRVLERRLEKEEFLAGDYSIADIACYPWIRYIAPSGGRDAYPAIARWFAAVSARPAIEASYARARTVDMGVPRNSLDTAKYPIHTLTDGVMIVV